jgi:hypothetical protein
MSGFIKDYLGLAVFGLGLLFGGWLLTRKIKRLQATDRRFSGGNDDFTQAACDGH